MNIRLEKKEKCLAALSIEVPAETVASERAKILKAFVRQARIPGFRPGKAPKEVFILLAVTSQKNKKTTSPNKGKPICLKILLSCSNGSLPLANKT